MIALCAGLLLMGTGAFAAGNPPELPRTTVVRAGSDLEVLLRKAEEQISNGHTMTPADDNAIGTWKRVLEIVVGNDAPEVRSALEASATRLQDRAAAETVAGRMNIASDLNVFAAQARRMIGNSTAATPATIAPGTRRVPPEKQASAGETAASTLAKVSSPPPFTPLASSMTTPPPPTVGPAGNAKTSPDPAKKPPDKQGARVVPGTALAANATPAVELPSDSGASPEEQRLAADLYVRRGDEFLAAKNVAAARKFYGYAAIAGNAHAAIALARTYDLEVVPRPGAPAEARAQQSATAPKQVAPTRRRAHLVRTKTPAPETPHVGPDGSVAW